MVVGDSGAPVLVPEGRIVGVLFARSDRRPGTAYAVDAEALGPVLGAVGEAMSVPPPRPV